MDLLGLTMGIGKFYRPRDHERDLRQAWPDWDAHVAEFHKPIHYDGQIGSEATPQEFLDALLAATREMVRVLKPTGSIFVNLGDKYASTTAGGNNNGTSTSTLGHHKGGGGPHSEKLSAIKAGRSISPGVPTKSLMGIPWRYALRCIDELGLILRAEIIWSKPNGLPESVTDRVRRSHEQWFHFVRQPRYFSAVDEIREPQVYPNDVGRYSAGSKWMGNTDNTKNWSPAERTINPLGKLPGSVWRVTHGVSLIRSILDAVAAGGITPEEGERLWTRLSDSYLMSDSLTVAGSGSDIRIHAATAKPHPTSANTPKTGHIELPTDSSSDLSQMDTPSTTSAATSPASTPNTSSQSLDERTSAEHPLNEQSVNTDTHSLTHTLKSLLQDSPANDAASAPAKNRSDSDSSVWNVPTQPLAVPPELGIDHFAAYPMEFPRRIITGWTPTGVCTGCGEGRRPTTEHHGYVQGGGLNNGTDPNTTSHGKPGATLGLIGSRSITGYTCPCDSDGYRQAAGLPLPPTTPSIVVDPFGGTGTTALVAKALGRIGITIDLSSDYCRLAKWRCNDPRELAAALQVEKPEPVHPDQLDLFGEA